MAAAPSIGTAIKRARERKRWTQRQLADATGVNTKTVVNWETGRTSPKNRLGALEDVLGISLAPAPDPLSVPLEPENEWEREVLADEELDLEVRRALVLDWRHARDEALAQARREAARKAARSAAS